MQTKYQKQKDGYCGPASLKIIFDSLGVEKTQEELAVLSEATHDQGVQNKGMIKAINALGLHGEILTLLDFQKLTEILNEGQQVILIWWSPDFNGGHYSPLLSINADRLQIVETKDGSIKSYKFKEFEPYWFDFAKETNRTQDDLELRAAIIICRK